MSFPWIDFILFVLLFILFVIVITFNRITPIHKVYLAFHFVMMLWPLGQFGISITEYPLYQLFFINLSFIAIGMLGPCWLIFVYFLTGKEAHLKWTRMLAYTLPAIISVVLALWNPGNQFMIPVDGNYYERLYGPIFWILILIQFAYFFIALMNMYYALRTVTSLNQRKQLATALVGMFVLTGFGLMDVLVNIVLNEWLPVLPGLLALGIFLSDVCFVVAIYRYGMFDILSLAQRDILEHMTTGILVLDENNKVLEVNKGVSPFVQSSKGECFEMERLLTSLDEQGEVNEFLYRYTHHPNEKLQMEFALNENAGRHVSIQISPILDDHRSLIGRIITFHDVTELRKLVMDMNRKNETLHERNLELIKFQDELFQLNQKLEKMAITDSLTGCYNRRYLIQQLEYEVLLNMRYQIPFAIFLFDIDYFKQINDQYGHLAGDEVIRSTADIVRKMLRRTDILARYGGEEFTVYLPHTNKEQAVMLAERIMQGIAHNWVIEGDKRMNVTVSMGVLTEESAALTFDDPKEYLRDLFSRVDLALYKAKNEGRNRVMLAN